MGTANRRSAKIIIESGRICPPEMRLGSFRQFESLLGHETPRPKHVSHPWCLRGSTAPSAGGQKIYADNPMDQETRARNLSQAPRCGAKTRAGTTCRRPAIHGRKRCRLHGGLSPGAPRGFRNGNFKNGNWTAEAVAERRWLRSLVRSFDNSGTTV